MITRGFGPGWGIINRGFAYVRRLWQRTIDFAIWTCRVMANVLGFASISEELRDHIAISDNQIYHANASAQQMYFAKVTDTLRS